MYPPYTEAGSPEALPFFRDDEEQVSATEEFNAQFSGFIYDGLQLRLCVSIDWMHEQRGLLTQSQ